MVGKFSDDPDTRTGTDAEQPRSDGSVDRSPRAGLRSWDAGRPADRDDPDAGPRPGVRDPGASPPEGVDGVAVETGTGGPTVTLHVGLESRDLSRAEARELRDALSEALTDRSEFVHTAGEHREDGAYVVERRGATSSGHRKVFDSFAECRRRYETLPREFTAADLSAADLSGGRRHMLAWHYVEHPAFDCELVARQPLTVEKRGDPPAD